jgi:hypothetical protein
MGRSGAQEVIHLPAHDVDFGVGQGITSRDDIVSNPAIFESRIGAYGHMNCEGRWSHMVGLVSNMVVLGASVGSSPDGCCPPRPEVLPLVIHRKSYANVIVDSASEGVREPEVGRCYLQTLFKRSGADVPFELTGNCGRAGRP